MLCLYTAKIEQTDNSITNFFFKIFVNYLNSCTFVTHSITPPPNLYFF